MRDLFTRLNKFEIKIRKAVNSHHKGNFNSIFKGTGLEFSDLRTYQYGDDVRTIDWITTAKGHGAFVKIFKEEKEQNVFFLLDVSASQEVGQKGHLKLDRAKEICGVLAISAIKEGGHVGLFCFSDQKEFYLKPDVGMKHAYTFISKMFQLKPISKNTSLVTAISFALNFLKRKSVTILISDFRDEAYEHNLKALAKKHDLVVVHIYDQREVNLPSMGILPVYDKESGRTVWLNTSSRDFKDKMNAAHLDNQKTLETLCKQYNASYISISSTENFIQRLIELFRVRR